jgi:adenosine deaminase
MTPLTPAAAPRNILLCTLGASWAVIPEILGWLAPSVLDLYAHHPHRAALDGLRQRHHLEAPHELWLCTTEGAQTQASLAHLHAWWRQLGAPMPLRIWTAAGTDQLGNQAECDHIRELTLRVCLLASEATHGGQLVLSLAGGRKTMSADLQHAGMVFGAHVCLHVVGPDPLPAALLARSPEERANQPTLFARPLAPELAGAITPLIAATGQRNELLDIVLDGRCVNSASFAVPLATPTQPCAWPAPADGDTLDAELTHRQRQGSQLLGNFLAQVAQQEHHENWRSLYRLSPANIAHLRNTPLDETQRDWLLRLPKADIHRHLGGCLDLAAQQRVAHAIWQASTRTAQQNALAQVQTLLNAPLWPWTWPHSLHGPHRALASAALLLHATPEQLQHNLFAVTEPRVALKNRSAHGFAAYERPGELSGSALLCHPAALAPYAQAVVTQALQEGLCYLELRGSPHKYRPLDPTGFLRDLSTELDRALAAAPPMHTASVGAASSAPLRIGFVWIVDRRQPQQVPTVVQAAVAARAQIPDFLLGLDLAGDEGTHNPAVLATGFAPAFAECLPLTIHAGEGEAAQNIWQAAYHLHADRIGHGLTLAEHAQLAARFRNRGICLELCPSSNREVVGFFDPAYPATEGLPRHPLRRFMEQGLPLTLCTDNPGISRTSLADEYLAAARMSEGGLTLWETLALTRQAFVHAFLPAADRELLLKRMDEQVFALHSPGMVPILGPSEIGVAQIRSASGA